MTVNSASRRREKQPIRPIDPAGDMRDVIHLIDEAFSGELNPMAQQTLRDLRALARLAWLLGPFVWATPFYSLFSGLVWTENGLVVGNVTVTRSRGGGPGCWLISNVVVAPTHRGLGIGRALMEAALANIRDEGGRRAILQVRADNLAAMRLYRGLGFSAVDTLLEMLLSRPRPVLDSKAELFTSRRVHERTHSDGFQEYLLAREAIPAAAQQMRPLNPASFQVGWLGLASRLVGDLVGSAREYRLGIVEQDVLRATLNVWGSRRLPYHRLQIMVHPQYRGEWEQELVDHGLLLLRRHTARPVYAETYAAHEAAVTALQQRGFATCRELVQMVLDIGNAPTA